MLTKDLLSRFSYKIAGNILAVLLGFATLFILTRSLGPERLGEFEFTSQSFLNLFNFALFSAPVAFFTYVSMKDKSENISTEYKILLSIIFFIFICFLILISQYNRSNTIYNFIPGSSIPILIHAALWAFLSFLATISSQIADAKKHTKSFEIIRFYTISLRFICLLSLYVSEQLTLLNYFIVFNASLIFQLVIFNYQLRRVLFFSKEDSTKKSHFISYVTSYIKPLIFLTIIGFITSYGDRWLLQIFSGNLEQGLLSFVLKITSYITIFTGAILPVLAREFTQENEIQSESKLFHLWKVFFVIGLFFCVFIFVTSEEIILIFGGEKFLSARIALMIGAFIPIHQVLGQFVTTYFMATGDTKNYSLVGSVGNLLSLPLLYILLAPEIKYGLNLGALGVILKTAIIQVIIVFILFKVAFKKNKIPYKDFIFFQFGLSVFTFSIGLFSWLLTNQLLGNIIKSKETAIITLITKVIIFTTLGFFSLLTYLKLKKLTFKVFIKNLIDNFKS